MEQGLTFHFLHTHAHHVLFLVVCMEFSCLYLNTTPCILLLQAQPQQNEQLEELEEEDEEPHFQEETSLDAPHAVFQSDSAQDHPPSNLHSSFATDSSEEEEQPLLLEGSPSGPSPLHVLEDLASEEATCADPETTDRESPSPEDAAKPGRPASCPQSSLFGVSRGEKRIKMDSPPSKHDWQLIEKIKSYYEGAEVAREAAEPANKECAHAVPPGVVRESVLRFNSILRQNDARDWLINGARHGKLSPLPPSWDKSGRERSRSCSTQLLFCRQGVEEGWSQLPTSPEHSGRGRSQSDSTQSSANPEHSSSKEVQWSRGSCDASDKECGQPASIRTDISKEDYGSERPCQEPKSGSGLEGEGPEFKSCAEIRRAWQEKEQSTLDTPKKVGERRSKWSQATLETPLYCEPLCIVEDSDLEETPSVPHGDPEGVACHKQATGRRGMEIQATSDGNPSYLRSLDLYETDGDPCLLENSERIISKVQALAKMYSEKISRLKAPRRGLERPGRRVWSAQRKSPVGTLRAESERKPVASVLPCE